MKYAYMYKIENYCDNEIYLKICYKNLYINWVLQTFNIKELNNLSKIILKNTKYYNLSYIFKCNSRADLDIIYKILIDNYKNNKLPDIDIVSQKIKNFIHDNYEWLNFN